MMICSVKGVASDEKPTENFHLTLQLLGFMELYSEFLYLAVQMLLYCFGSLSQLS